MTNPGQPDSPQDPTGPADAGCPRRPEAATYLLGALSPAERADYSAHLDTCGDCLHEVGQLAGLPGLLARTPGEAVPKELPDDPVPAAVAAVRRYRTRRRTAVAASVVVLAGAVLGVGVLFGRAAPSTSGPSAVALPVQMQPVGGQPVTAELGFAQRSWGTAINLSCRLDGATGSAPEVFVLVAVAQDGSTQELARWQALPNEDAKIATATDLAPDQLRALEVRVTPTGSTVLRTEEV